ncbi:MAG: DNA polymerase/3'-5' exonuclease PolX [Candidatus Eremiobacteraeota bacterium]|nr:DNA polymerase/3'-5' exonuclease PolX [Candidatus Eremiobacteraeota bacterium]
MTNAEIARRLIEIRTLMELAGEPFFKYTAYERAASAIENAAPVAELIARDDLRKLPGVGKSIAATVQELCEGGDSSYLTELHQKFPPSIFEVLGVAGIGTKTAALLYERYGIASLADLEKAVDGGVLTGAPRMGKKSVENIKRGILARKGRNSRTPLGEALPLAREIMDYLRKGPAVERLTCAGSVRRAEDTVGDIDIVCTAPSAQAVIAHFVGWERAHAVLGEGPTKASVWLSSGLQIDLRVLPDHLYGNLLQHFTGSREHNIQLREYAGRKGLSVSENGILEMHSGRSIACRAEAEVYETLGMQYIPPELRSGIGEIKEALERGIPDLLKVTDVQGDFHMHSTWSDGNDTLDAMIAAAAARGYRYHAMSDHSVGRGNIGMRPEELRRQRKVISEIGDRYGIRTLCASEVDILADGRMDYSDEQLAELDIVIGSVHSGMSMTREAMTVRLIRACENRFVNIIGHPTGRAIGSFSGYEFDYDAVFGAAARTGTALEIDGQLRRLDLPAPLASRAKKLGVTFTVDSDAHAVSQLPNVELAVSQARRAGLQKSDVLNAQPLETVLAFVRKKRETTA